MKDLSTGVCAFAFEASKVQMVPAAERALDLQAPWVVGRCERLPVCVCVGGGGDTAPHLKEHTALEVPLSRFQGSPGTVSSPRPAGGSQRVQPLAVISSSPGYRAHDAAGGGGSFGGGGASQGPPCTSGAIGSARLCSPPVLFSQLCPFRP